MDPCTRESGREVVNWNILLLVLMLFFHQRGYVGVSATDEGLTKVAVDTVCCCMDTEMEEVDLCMRESGREVVNWNILLLVLMLFFHQRGYVGVSATDEGLPKYCLCSYLSHFPALLAL